MVTLVSHAAALLAYGMLGLLVALGGALKGPSFRLLIACIATALWAVAVLFAAALVQFRSFPDLLLETARSASWLAFLHALLASDSERPGGLAGRRIMLFVGAICVSLVVVDLALWRGARSILQLYDSFARVGLAIIGLVLLENLARNDRPSMLWAAKFAFIALGGVFAYDLFFYSEALLFQRVNHELFAARGLVSAMAVPLMVIAFARNPKWAVDVHVSRDFVFHSFTLILSGVYLVLMALTGYWLRSFGGSWGMLFEVGFLFAALVVVFVTVTSLTFRAFIRRFVSTHFFSYKYDYRKEWTAFIRVISAQKTFLPLHERAVQAIANVVDSPAGALWMRQSDEEPFTNTAAWHLPPMTEAEEIPRDVVDYFERTGMPLRADGEPLEERYGTVPPPPIWLAQVPRAWLMVPLIHHEAVLGVLVLSAPRSPREMTLEDYELLMMLGRQTASYLAEEEAAKALVDARQLEAFNRRFAFVVHDIKNLASQLSLILKNAERHGQNPDFQRDALATVRNSVARMNTMLEQLGAERKRGANAAPVDLRDLVAGEWPEAKRPANLELRPADRPVVVELEPEQLLRVLRHLVQNALDAVADRGHVRVEVGGAGREAIVRIVDDGPGMTPEFIRDHLFRPFDSTKSTGYGIGAFQARQLVRELGGRLEVTSQPGRGTEFRVILPIRQASTAALQVKTA